MAPNENPFLDKHPRYPNIVIGAGFSGSCTDHLYAPLTEVFIIYKGHGFKLSPVVGKILSELALDRQLSYDLSLFKIDRVHEKMSGKL